MSSLEIAALGLRQDIDRLSLTSQNIANASTQAYKRQVAVQQPFFDQFEAQAAQTVTLPGAQMDLRAGKLMHTGNALDIALPDGSYLLVESENGDLALTRQGALRLDGEGVLRTAAGRPVLGQRGKITAGRETRDLSIDSSGRVMAGTGMLDTLRLVKLQPGAYPLPLGDGLLQLDASQWGDEAAATGLQSGYLEQSNVVASQEMMSLMSMTRHAESMVRVFQTADEMADIAIRRFGENT